MRWFILTDGPDRLPGRLQLAMPGYGLQEQLPLRVVGQAGGLRLQFPVAALQHPQRARIARGPQHTVTGQANMAPLPAALRLPLQYGPHQLVPGRDFTRGKTTQPQRRAAQAFQRAGLALPVADGATHGPGLLERGARLEQGGLGDGHHAQVLERDAFAVAVADIALELERLLVVDTRGGTI